MKDTPDNEANHPYFGPCDANAPGARCFECARMRGDAPLSNDERRALTMRADSADWTAEALAVESRVLRVAVTALTTRALLAEAERDEARRELANSHEWRRELTAQAARWGDAATAAEARVKELQAELGEQEEDMLRLIQENMTRII